MCFFERSITVDYTFDAQSVNYDALKTGIYYPDQIEVRVSGKIKHSLFNKANFIGEIRIDRQLIDNPVDLSYTTPTLSYYLGPRLITVGYILAYSSNLNKMAIIVQETEDKPRRLVLCNMTYEEAVRMQVVNELPADTKNAVDYDTKLMQ